MFFDQEMIWCLNRQEELNGLDYLVKLRNKDTFKDKCDLFFYHMCREFPLKGGMFAFTHFPHVDGLDAGDLYIRSNFSPNFNELYYASPSLDVHTIAALLCDEPFYHMDEKARPWLSQEQLVYYNSFNDMGYRAGWTVPFRNSANTVWGGIGFSADGLSYKKFRRESVGFRERFEYICWLTIRHIITFIICELSRKVTPQQIDTIKLLRKGLSEERIGVVQGTSRQAANKKIRKATNAMKANTPVDLVNKMVAYNLLKGY
ncbi:MAG: autoinducer binding domain-containing protein [Candidatus Thiodiazotropha lotti]|nr:autoinducer binding domain-containing protein [Candidatus Thiodiazotropha lotti]